MGGDAVSGDQREERTDAQLIQVIEGCVPTPTARPDWDDVVRRAGDTASRRTGRRHQGVIWLAAAAAAIAVVTLTAVLRHTSPKPMDSSAPTIAPARVDWGMTADLRVTPDPGVPMDQARERAMEALRTRAALRDIAGFEVSDVSPDTIRIRVPAAEEKDQLEDLTRFDRIEVIDPQVSILGTDDSLEKLGAVAPGHHSPTGVRYWLSSHTNRLFPPVAFSTLAEARKAAVFAPAGAYEPVALPSTFTAVSLQSDGPEPTYAVIDEQRLASGAEIESVRADGDRVTITVSPDAQARLRSAGALAVAQIGAGGGGVTVLADDVHLVGYDLVLRTRTQSTATSLMYSTEQPGMEATVTLTTTARYGTRPIPVGKPYTPPAPPPDPFTTKRTKVNWRLIDIPPDLPDGSRVEVTVGVAGSEPLQASFMFTSTTGYPGGGSRSACPRGLGAPIVQVCASSLQEGSTPEGKLDGSLHVALGGQVAPDVRSVEIQFPSGQSAVGPAKDGWFFVRTTVHGDDRATDPRFIARTADGDVAFEGMPISMVQPYNGHSLAEYHQMEIARQTQKPGWARPDEAATMTVSTSPTIP